MGSLVLKVMIRGEINLCNKYSKIKCGGKQDHSAAREIIFLQIETTHFTVKKNSNQSNHDENFVFKSSVGTVLSSHV